MSSVRRLQYGPIRLLEVECGRPEEWDTEGATHLRVCLPANDENMSGMLARGFLFADRLLDVSINLSRSKLDFASLVRLQPRLTTEKREQVLSIAQQSFPTDRRFHLSPHPDPAVAAVVLERWVAELPSYYLCEHKGEPIGFLALAGEGEQRSVHLAAVLERYRASGAALSLYAAAARDCREAGVRLLNGRISSTNPAVMNLYAFLGASFSNPTDVYLKEV